MHRFMKSITASSTGEKLKVLAVLYKAGDGAKNPRLLGTINNLLFAYETEAARHALPGIVRVAVHLCIELVQNVRLILLWNFHSRFLLVSGPASMNYLMQVASRMSLVSGNFWKRGDMNIL